MGCTLSEQVEAIDINIEQPQPLKKVPEVQNEPLQNHVQHQQNTPNSLYEEMKIISARSGRIRLKPLQQHGQPTVLKHESRNFEKQLVNLVQNIFRNNTCVKNFLQNEIYQDLLKYFQQKYYKISQKLQFFEQVLKILNQAIRSKNNGHYFDFCLQIGEKLQKLDNEVFFNNKNTLKILKYFARQKTNSDKDFISYGCVFQDLDFSFQLQVYSKMASTVRYLCNYDLNAFSLIAIFLTQILLKEEQEEKKDLNILEEKYKQLEKSLLQCLKQIQKNYPASDAKAPTLQKIEILDSIKMKQYKVFIPLVVGHQDNAKILKQFIVQKAIDARQDYIDFVQLVKSICVEKGYGFKSGVKVKNEEDTSSIMRVMEKLLEQDINNLKVYSLEEYFMKDYASKQEQFPLIKHFIRVQEQKAVEKIKMIVKNKSQLQFTVADMVRGKCMFNKVSQLIITIEKLVQGIQKKGFSIVGIKNRLSKHTKDFMFKIKLKKSVAELQLALSFDSVANQFNHKIYQLLRSNLYSPITNLFIHKQKWAKHFCAQLLPQIKAMQIKNTEQKQFEEGILFKEVSQDFQDFLIDFGIEQPSQVKIEEVVKFQKIINQFVDISCSQSLFTHSNEKSTENIQRLFNSHAFYKGLKKNQKSLALLEKIFMKKFNALVVDWTIISKTDKILLRDLYQRKAELLMLLGKNQKAIEIYKKCTQLQKELQSPETFEYADLLNHLGNLHQRQDKFEKALKYYSQSLRIKSGNSMSAQDLQSAKIVENIGLVYLKMGKLDQALEKCLNSSKIKQKLSGYETIQYADVLINLGMCYFKKDNFTQALEQFKKSLSIVQKVKGKQSVEYSYRLNNIGNVLRRQQKFQQALECYHTSLTIKQKIQGKDSLDASIALHNIGLIYDNMGKLQDALEMYQKSLQIKKKYKKNDTLEFAYTLNNCGILYEKLGYYEVALAFYAKSLQQKQILTGKQSLDCAMSLTNMANLNAGLGNYDVALSEYTRTLSIKEKLLGKNHIQVGYLHYNLSSVHKFTNKLQLALQEMQKSYSIYLEQLGQQNKGTQAIAEIIMILKDEIENTKIKEKKDEEK